SLRMVEDMLAVLTPVPSNEHYAYAVVNDQRVIIDPRTHTVVQIVR
ncbi:DUF1236 domain-containing protein, partial [Agrobacterium tumefaciens]